MVIERIQKRRCTPSNDLTHKFRFLTAATCPKIDVYTTISTTDPIRLCAAAQEILADWSRDTVLRLNERLGKPSGSVPFVTSSHL